MRHRNLQAVRMLNPLCAIAISILLAGCPDDFLNPVDTDYDAGFDEGFLEDNWY